MNSFRRYLAVVCVVAMMGASSSAFGNFLVVTPEQVSVTSEGLFVSVHGIPIAVESLNTANDGYVVAIPSPDLWYCKNCKKHVIYPIKDCPRCGNPNPKDQGS